MQIVHTANAGIAAGFLTGSSAWLVAMIAIAVLVGLVAVAVVSGARRGLWLPVGLVLGGTVSNVIDRVHYGAVTDFLVVAP